MHWPYKQLLVLQILLFRIESCESQNNNDKQDFCSNLYCENERSSSACGIREEGEGFKLRLFENNCELMKYGCEVEDEKAYGIINPEYCKQLFMDGNNINKPESYMDDLESETVSPCVEFDCSYPTDAKEVCGIRQDGRGFKVRMFTNKCQLITHNCMNKTNFTRTDLLFCNGVDVPEDTNSNVMKVRRRVYRRAPNVVVIDANMFNFNNNITEAVDNFFAATHVFDLPIDEMNKHVNETARRMLINIFGPQVVFKPWIYIPTNISEDAMHSPTLSSCFHKCPTVCPNTYAPVCGQPGLAAREPSLMFMNHCYMDAAQCKMRWEANSDTAESSSYIESTFMFCLGDSYNTVFRFLPLVRTLQHMGRLKKKGYFRYKMRNMRFLNNMLLREPNPQGR